MSTAFKYGKVLDLYKISDNLVTPQEINAFVNKFEAGEVSEQMLLQIKTSPTEVGRANLLKGVANVVTEVAELTQSTKNHLKFGDVKITIKNSQAGDPISETIRKVTDPPITVPSNGVNVQYHVSGIHFEDIFSPGLVEEIAGTRSLVTTLGDGTEVYKSNIRVWVQEANNGAGLWKSAGEKTWWPPTWSEQKVWSSISEAFNTKISIGTNKWEGIALDGTKIEMYTDLTGNIKTAYILI